MATEPRPKLGRGLASLLGPPAPSSGSQPAVSHRQQRRVAVERIRPNPNNPRKDFGEAELADLANSIRARGVLQPIVVRAAAGVDDAFEIIAGERRWRAAQRAAIHDIPVIVVEADDRLALELAIIENVQRADLNAAEEARGYKALISEHGYGQAELGQAIGKSRSHVANTMRLLGLPPHALSLLESGAITAGHARALLALDNPDAVADEIVAGNLTVRDIEKRADGASPRTRVAPKRGTSDAQARALSDELTKRTGFKIAVTLDGESGRVTIETKTLDQFDHLHRKLCEL